MAKILVTGSKSGLGSALVHALLMDSHEVFEWDIEDGKDVRQPNVALLPPRLDILVNCAGINYIEWLDNLREENWHEVMDTNAKGIYMMTQACLPLLRASTRRCPGGTVLNIISNAAHVPMTCSLAYNASKAAAHMMTLQMARELTPKYGITVFGVAPNKMKGTGMSHYIERTVPKVRGWTAQQAADYQAQSLPAGETPPWLVAELIAYLLSTKERHQHLTGCILPYGA